MWTQDSGRSICGAVEDERVSRYILDEEGGVGGDRFGLRHRASSVQVGRPVLMDDMQHRF